MRVLSAMSGGVDSSVATALLLEAGFETAGVTLRLFDAEDIGLSGRGENQKDIEDARRAASDLGIDHMVLDLRPQFKSEVIERFAGGYIQGITPNPCLDCNKRIKFGALLDEALRLGYDHIATGHYARVARDETTGRFLLKKAACTAKDQSYVLYSLTQDVLKHVLFPLGELDKDAVRGLAAQRGLRVADKPDSQDICFVKQMDYIAFLENVLGLESRPGDFTDTTGNVLGRHKGLIRYTVGQRKGLELNAGRPMYVVRKNAGDNTVIVGEERELYTQRVPVGDVNFIPFDTLAEPMRVEVKVRYSQTAAVAEICPADNGRIDVVFDAPQRAVTPGQAAVFYKGDLVIGGGRILDK